MREKTQSGPSTQRRGAERCSGMRLTYRFLEVADSGVARAIVMWKSIAVVGSLIFVILGVVATPAHAQQTRSRLQSMQEDDTGTWWNTIRQDANDGDAMARGLRMGVVHGCRDGFEMSLVHQTRSFDDFKKRRDALMRSDLTMDQILANVDGYYAEPGNRKAPICFAVIKAQQPPA